MPDTRKDVLQKQFSERRPDGTPKGMAPLPVPMANSVAALQPAAQPAKIAQRFKTRDEYKKFYEKKDKEKDYNDYGAWASSEARNKQAPKQYNPSRGAASNPKLQPLVGAGSGLIMTDEDSEVNLFAYGVDQEYQKLVKSGATHEDAINELEAAYGKNGYAWPKRPNDYYRGFIPATPVYDSRGRVVGNTDNANRAVKEGLPRNFLESLVRRNDLIG